jgi:CDP-diacylglycerol--glycerol-3-phosphate 3-phosphatidyltransferase
MSSRAAAEAVGRGTHVAALPNLLSLLRIGLVPVLVALLAWPTRATRIVAGACFLLACVTDFLDGYLARRRGITSVLGQFLDPLADKMIVSCVLIMLAAVPAEPRVPAWMVVVIVVRELAVTGLRTIASRGGVLLPALELGKYKMIFQMFALEGLILRDRYPVPGTGLQVDFHAAGMVLLWVALVLGVWSAIDYHVRILRQVDLR